jgi:hypothetical protein
VLARGMVGEVVEDCEDELDERADEEGERDEEEDPAWYLC